MVGIDAIRPAVPPIASSEDETRVEFNDAGEFGGACRNTPRA